MRETNLGGGGKGKEIQTVSSNEKMHVSWGVSHNGFGAFFRGIFGLDGSVLGEKRVRGGGDGSMEMK